ncbi:hypothetical protein PS639_04172 [Pseudomonas fluorescens]|nr:hypothetical protein PS639_04172 [Pseudomonas fluorescens]
MMKATTLNKIGGAVGLGCVACCAIPMLGLMGLSAITITASDWWLALTLVALSVGALVYRNVRHKRNRCANSQKPCKGAECSGR